MRGADGNRRSLCLLEMQRQLGRRTLIVVGKIVQCQCSEISVPIGVDDRLVAITGAKSILPIVQRVPFILEIIGVYELGIEAAILDIVKQHRPFLVSWRGVP